MAWAAVGNSIGAYDAAVKYAGERIQFSKEIGGHQLVQELFAKSLGNITPSSAARSPARPPSSRPVAEPVEAPRRQAQEAN